MDANLSSLTGQERELLKAVRLSLNLETIAERLDLSVADVQARLHALENRLERLGLSLSSAFQDPAP